jgi:F0F1-type ATP synthase alpha subunit
MRPIELKAPGIIDRQDVKEPMQTGSRSSTPSPPSAAASAS